MGKGVLKSQVVGTIGIQVSPDLGGFWSELNRKLRERRPEAEVNVDFDATQVRRELNRAVRVAEKGVRDAQIGIDLDKQFKAYRKGLKNLAEEVSKYKKKNDTDIFGLADLDRVLPNLTHKFKLEPDRDALERTRTLLDGFFEREYKGRVHWEIDGKTARAALEKAIRGEHDKHENYVLKVNADVDVENGSVDRALNELRNEFRRRAFQGESFDIEIKPEMSDHDLRQVGRKLRKLHSEWDDKDLEWNLGLDHSARYIAAARLAYLARDRWVKFRPIIDNKALAAAATTLAALSGGRLVKDLSQTMWDWVKNLDKATPKFGIVASGLGGITSAVTQLLSHTIGVAGSLGHILQMVGLLGPGFLIAGGLLASAFVVPLFKAKNHVQDILDDWSEMSDLMGSAFWTAAMDDFTAAHERAFGVFSRDMQDLSRAAGKHFGRVSDAISRIVAPRFHEWVKHASAGLEEMASHSDGFASMIDVLGRHGSAGLERFLGWLGRTTDAYAAWLREAESTGKLQMMIDRGITALVDSGRALKNFGTTLGGVYEVVRDVGGADLGAMADGLERWSEVTHSAGFQDGLRDFLAGMKRGWTELKVESGKQVKDFLKSWSMLIGNVGGSVGSAGGKLLAGFATTFSGTKFNSGFREFFSGLNDGLDKLAKTWPKASGMLGDVLSFMGSLGRGFSPVIGSVIEGFARAAERLVDPLSRIVETSGPRMADTIDTISRAATPLLEAFAKIIEYASRIPGVVEGVTLAFVGLKGAATAFKVGKDVFKFFDGLKTDGGKAVGAIKGLFSAGAGGGIESLTGGIADATTKTGGLKSALGGVTAFLTGPWGIALAGGALAAGWFAFESTQHVREGASEMKAALVDLANSSIESSDRVVEAMRKMGQHEVWFGENYSQLPEAGTLLKRRTAERNWFVQIGDFFGGQKEAGGAADAVLSAFKEIDRIAAADMGAAVRQLRAIRDGFVEAGYPASEFRDVLAKQLESYPSLVSHLSNLSEHLALGGFQVSAMDLAVGDLNVEWAKAQVEAARTAETTRTMNAVMDASVSKFGLSADAAQGLVDVVGRMGPAFVDFASAATDAEGQAVTSVQDLYANVRAQFDSYQNWADNAATLAAEGLSNAVIEQMSRLPQGAEYMQQMVDLIAEGTDSSLAEARRLIDGFNEVGPAMSGVASAAGGAVAEMAASLDLSFADLLAAADTALSQLPVTADLRGVQTVDQLVAALAGANVSVSAEGENLVFAFANGLDQPVVARVAGANLGGAAKQGVAEGATGGAEIGSAFAADVSSGVTSPSVTVGAGRAMMVAIADEATTAASGESSAATGAAFATALAVGMTTGAPMVANAAKALVTAATTAAKPTEAWNLIGVNWVKATGGGIDATAPSVKTAASTMVSNAISAARSQASGGEMIGRQIANGVRSGINQAAGSVASAAATMVTNAINAARAAADINSPSRKMMHLVGEPLGEGVEVGMRNQLASLLDTAGMMTAAVISTMSAGARNAEGIGAMWDARPSRALSATQVDGPVMVAVDPRSFEGATMPIVVDGEQMTGFVEGVSAGVVRDFDSVRDQ